MFDEKTKKQQFVVPEVLAGVMDDGLHVVLSLKDKGASSCLPPTELEISSLEECVSILGAYPNQVCCCLFYKQGVCANLKLSYSPMHHKPYNIHGDSISVMTKSLDVGAFSSFNEYFSKLGLLDAVAEFLAPDEGGE